MRERLKNKFITPVGGWGYRDADTKKLCRSGSFDGLVDMVVRHRRANGLDIPDGFPQIIEHEVCRGLPDSMVTGRTEPVEKQQLRLFEVQKNTERLLQDWVHAGRPLESNDEVIARSDVCQHCKDNMRVGCLNCKGIPDWVFGWVGRARRTGYEELLHACRHGEVLLMAAVNFPVKTLPGNNTVPAHCWRRNNHERDDQQG